ncbi:fibulin-1 isoform X2 [Ixodes scapularis]|uniref:fibulin-1 isoform X2 n=1 Tax=Ixodes scapularis TaxID=6945 RepID=UPI001A9F6264|nr:fibulin-1 isoform X2 [Ixodes scapularis]
MSRQVACVHALVWVLLYVGTIGADVESTFYKCCQEGNMWAASASSCDSLAKKALASVVSEEHRSSCEITMDICCRATMRERFCDAGKAAARSNKGCETPDDQCPGDTYKDCCDGCRLGLAAAKLGTSCNFDTFSLGLPWDDAFQHCCTGKDEQSAAPDHENEVLVPTNGKGPKEGCPAGFKMRDDGSCMPIGPPQEHHPKPADGHLCEQYNPCMHKCRNSGTTLVCECHEGYRLEEDNKSCADVDECSDGTHNCDLMTHECMNKPGGFGCIPRSDTDVPSVDSETPQQCEAGFKYNSAMKDCIDVDECSEGLDDCGMEQQTCLNTYGGFQCLSKDGKECPAGYKWNEDSCADVDECQEGTHTCGSVQLCTNTEGGFTCRTTEQCQKGFRYNRVTRKCEDIDECQERTHDCNLRSQACINVNGSYSCRNKIRCPAGYRLDENTRSCIDVDECLHGLHSCSSRESKCVNTVGSYRCIKKSRYYDCPRGFVYSSHLKGCEDVDECAEGLDGCSDDQVCVNAVGSFSCVPRAPQAWCHRGYRRDPVTRRCEDINECQEYTHSCVGDMVCINTKGSYMCEKRQPTNPGVKDHSGGQHGNGHSNKCAPGMRSDPLTGDCRDINECEEQRPCGENERCHNLIGTYTCTCMDGYRRDSSTGPCKDINECQYGGHNCQIGFRCDNTPGSFTCVRSSGCGTGYTVNFATGLCEDDDECLMGVHNCQPGFVCRNTEGSFRCDRDSCPGGSKLLPDGSCEALNCSAGMKTDIFGKCVDINECHNRSLCGRYHRCINTVGSYQCESLLTCSAGYEPNQKGNQCLDVDECALGTHDCKSDQNCHNTPGNYVCECPIGFHMNTFRECEDIDECTRFRGKVCSVNSDCTNTPGSYTCECKDGFKRGVDPRSCIDVNECEDETDSCDHTCINVWGSYQCTCKMGYRLAEDGRACIDMNECEQWKGRGHLCIGTCVNEPGSYSCSCPEGYKLGSDKRTCHDIDECEQEGVCNGENEVCLNTRGSYRCNVLDCPPGYIRDTDHKTRCKRKARDCAQSNTTCLDQPVSLSYNYYTLVSNMKIPPSGRLDFFTMRGPRFSFSTVHFELEVIEATASSRAHGVEVATKNHFHMRRTGFNEAMVALVRPLQGPQDIQLQLQMKIYQHGLYAGNAVAKIFIFVTENEF